MSNDFYNPLVQTAGKIAEEYGISVSDVVGLLLQAGKDEALVRQVLDESMAIEGANSRIGLDRQFDLVAHARTLLQHVAARCKR
jgi:hypothetical protein